MMMKLFIAGGTGFVGSHLLKALSEKGFTGRCLVRNPEKHPPCPGFEIIEGSLEKIPPGALSGMDMAVHLVGIIAERSGATFRSIHIKGTENLVNESLRAGVRNFFYQSALGASINSKSAYMKTKALAEEIVRDSGMTFTIFRPSLILGAGDGFSRQMVELIEMAPVVPVPGDGKTLYQPVSIRDWVKCFLLSMNNPRMRDRTLELGGPEHISFNALIELYMEMMGIKKKLMHVPVSLVKTGVHCLRVLKKAGIKNLPPLTRDQLELLGQNNIADADVIRKEFGFEPLGVRDALKEFLPALTSPRAQDN